jgi:hypothetical protein
MAIRTLSTKKTKNDNSSRRQQEQNMPSPKPPQRTNTHRTPGKLFFGMNFLRNQIGCLDDADIPNG